MHELRGREPVEGASFGLVLVLEVAKEEEPLRVRYSGRGHGRDEDP